LEQAVEGGPVLRKLRLYVTVGRAGDVAVIDTAAGKVAGRLPAGTLPWGVTVADVPSSARYLSSQAAPRPA
jgi:YVTN family beta-propeller protein